MSWTIRQGRACSSWNDAIVWILIFKYKQTLWFWFICNADKFDQNTIDDTIAFQSIHPKLDLGRATKIVNNTQSKRFTTEQFYFRSTIFVRGAVDADDAKPIYSLIYKNIFNHRLNNNNKKTNINYKIKMFCAAV